MQNRMVTIWYVYLASHVIQICKYKIAQELKFCRCSVPMQQIVLVVMCKYIPGGSDCWKQSIIMKQFGATYASVSNAASIFAVKMLSLGSNTVHYIDCLSRNI
jgi:hypothetical protein